MASGDHLKLEKRKQKYLFLIFEEAPVIWKADIRRHFAVFWQVDFKDEEVVLCVHLSKT